MAPPDLRGSSSLALCFGEGWRPGGRKAQESVCGSHIPAFQYSGRVDPAVPGTIVSYATFLEVRERRQRVAAGLLRQNAAVRGGDPAEPEPPPSDAETVRGARA